MVGLGSCDVLQQCHRRHYIFSFVDERELLVVIEVSTYVESILYLLIPRFYFYGLSVYDDVAAKSTQRRRIVIKSTSKLLPH